MADINEILGRQINSVKELKAAIKELQDSLVGVDADSEQFKTTSEQLAAAQAELNKVTRAGKDDTDAAKDSLVGLRQEYKALYDQYKLLSDEQRNSDFGKNMAASLSQLSDKINETQKEIGDYRGNIGRYAQSVTEAFSSMGVSLGGLQGPLKLATGGFKTLNATMKASPVGWIAMAIAAVIAIFNKLKEAIGQNEELQMRFNEAMAKFRPIIDGVKNAIDWLAGALVKYIEFVAGAVQKMREFGAAITDFLGITDGAKERLQAQQKIYDDIAKSTNNLTKTKREYQKLNAEDTANVQRLREEASETENMEEKQRLLTEAKEKQAEIDQRNIEIAEEELRVLELQAQLTANDAEMNDKLAAATAKVSQAQAEAANNARAFNKQISAATSSTSKATSSAKNYREEAKKLYEQLIEDGKDEVTKLTEKYEKEKKLLEKYHLDTTLLTKKYNKEIAEIRNTAFLNGLKQQREDLEKEWNLWQKKGEEDIALALEAETLEKKTIPAVEKLKTKVSEFLKGFKDENLFQQLLPVSGFNEAFDISVKKMKEMEDLINKDTFAGLGDEYQNIKDDVNEINAAYGLSITTVSNLNTTLDELKTRLTQVVTEYNNLVKTKAGEEALERIQKRFQTLTEGLYGTLYNLFSNNDYKEIYEYAQDFAAKTEYTQLEVQKGILEEELSNFKGTQEQRIQILEDYYSVVDEMRNREAALEELDVQRRRQIWNDAFDSFISMANSTNTVLESIVNVRQAQMDADLKEGKISQQEYDKKKKRLKKLEELEVAVAVAGIAANTAAGIIDVWRGYAAELPVNAATAAAAGPGAAAVKAALDAKSLASAIIRTTTLTVEGGAQIAAAVGGYIAKSTAASSEAGSGDVSVGATPAMIDSTPYSYTRTVQTQEDVDRLNQPIWCSIVDIENALGQQAVVRDESSF